MTGGHQTKTAFAAAVLMERIVRDIYPARHSTEIQPLQWSILRYLGRMPPDQCELRWIARFLGLTRAPVARAVTTLQDRGLVSQHPGSADGRTKTIVLTSAGTSALKRDPIALVARRIDALPDDLRRNFIEGIRSLTLKDEGPDNDT